MSIPKVTDEQFISLFNEHKSCTKLSQLLNMNVRTVHSRRRSIEGKYAIDLNSPTKITKVEHAGRINLEIENGVVIVFSDAHYWPDTISTAHRALVQFVKNLKPSAVICNGDCYDGGAVSRFPRIGWDNKPTVQEELEAVKDRLGEIEAITKCPLTWNLGNHDARYETKLAAHAPEYEGVSGFCLKDHFPRWMPAWSTWINGNTVIKHRYKGGIHAAHNNAVQSGVNIITGHLHSLKVTPFSDYNGTRFGVDTGTLAHPSGAQFLDYSEDNPKNHRSGFVVLTFKNGELLWPEIVHVMDEDEGIVCFRGETGKF